MDFAKICEDRLKKITIGSVQRYNNSTYFSLEQLRYLPSIIRENNIIDEIAITPYYIFDNKIMELYDYALSIRINEYILGKEKYFLEETGEARLEDIDDWVLDKLDNTYCEVKKGDCESFIHCIERYIKYMQTNKSSILEMIKQEIDEALATTQDGIFYKLI